MISLSISRILESVYAHSAAEIVSTGVERPEILGRSHEEMLKVITRDTIAALAYAMMPIVTDSNIAEKPIPEVITLEIKVPDTVSEGLLRAAIETAVASGVLARAWSGSESPMHRRYSKAFEMSLEALSNISGHSTVLGCIAPTA